MSSPARILIVEDEGIISAHLQLALRRSGYVVVGATDSGEEALELARTRGPDLVVMDIGLAGTLDGIATAMELLARGSAPVVFLTAHADATTLERAKAAEPVGYLTKPFQEATLAATVEIGLHQRAVRARLEASEAAARAAEERLRSIEARVPGLVYQLRRADDGALSLPYASENAWTFLDQHGEAGADALAALLARVVAEDLETVRGAIEASARTLDELSLEFRASRRDGEVRWLATRATPQRSADGGVLFHGFVSDVTDAKRAEGERLELERTLLLAQKHESLGVMAAGIAHNFNNLLLTLLLNLEVAREATSPAGLAALDDATAAAQRAATISGVMLTYLGQGSRPRAPRPVAAELGELLPLLRPTFPPNVRLEVELADDTPWCTLDRADFRQLVLNVVTNAWEAAAVRGGRVRVTSRAVRAADRGEGAATRWARIEVADDGVGMDAATAERIFDPSFSTKFTGRGLGLPVAQGIVRAWGGDIHVETSKARGTVLVVLLPESSERERAEAAAEALRAEPASSRVRSASVAREPGPGPVLVVDDDATVRSATMRQLGRLGYDVVLASDGDEALAAFDARRGGTGAVVLDLSMPGLDGWSVLAELRRRNPAIYVVVASGYDVAGLRAEPRALEPDAWLQKPYASSDLASVLPKRGEPKPAG